MTQSFGNSIFGIASVIFGQFHKFKLSFVVSDFMRLCDNCFLVNPKEWLKGYKLSNMQMNLFLKGHPISRWKKIDFLNERWHFKRSSKDEEFFCNIHQSLIKMTIDSFVGFSPWQSSKLLFFLCWSVQKKNFDGSKLVNFVG